MINAAKIVCFDLEMCCWDDGRTPRTGEIIEIGVCKIDIVTGEIEKRQGYFVQPEHDEISEFCTSLTGITPQILKKQGMPLAEALRRLENDFGVNGVFASWGADHHVLRKECEAKSLSYPIRAHIDVSLLYRIKKRMGKKKHGMKGALGREGMELEGQHHSGAQDAYNLARLVLKVL